MRIALVSDIHGNLAALEAVAADIAQRNPDLVANLGDSLSGPLLPQETANFLMSQDWLHLAGNHERQLLTIPSGQQNASDAYARSVLNEDSLAWIAALKDTHALNPDVFLCHGSPHSDVEYLLETVRPSGMEPAIQDEIAQRLGEITSSLVACGHSHMPRSVRNDQGQLIVNPGSVGLPAYDDERPYFHVVENHSPAARYAIVEQRNNAWFAELIAVEYDYESMAQLAEARRRADWAIALRTGRVNSR